MWKNVPWTKTMLEDFIEEALLTEEEEKILRTRVAGWSIVKQALEFEMSTTTVSRYTKNIKRKYDHLHKLYPERFIERPNSEYEIMLDNTDPLQEYKVRDFFNKDRHKCGKDPYKMSIEELLECQKTCKYGNRLDKNVK